MDSRTSVELVTVGEDAYDLYEGSVALLEGATEEEVRHFLQHGHSECPDCPK